MVPYPTWRVLVPTKIVTKVLDSQLAFEVDTYGDPKFLCSVLTNCDHGRVSYLINGHHPTTYGSNRVPGSFGRL